MQIYAYFRQLSCLSSAKFSENANWVLCDYNARLDFLKEYVIILWVNKMFLFIALVNSIARSWIMCLSMRTWTMG